MTTPIRRRLQLSNLSDSSMDTSSSSVPELDLAHSPKATARLTSSPSFSKEVPEVPRLGADIGPETLSPIRLNKSQFLMTDFFRASRQTKRPHSSPECLSSRKRLKSTPEARKRICTVHHISPELRRNSFDKKENLKSDSLVSIPENSDPFADLETGTIIRKRSPRKRLSDSFISPVSAKRFGRSVSLSSPKCRVLQRSNSVQDHNIPSDKGDFSPSYFDFKEPLALPTEGCSKHQDLNYISGQTMAELLAGTRPETFVLVDARYPYEYEGGKINKGINLFKEDMIIQHFYPKGGLMTSPLPNIVIFHCEFSSERGPKMLRTLRNYDRLKNEYPNLDYPQLYLLKSGYKTFFKNHEDHTCGTYRPMDHPDFTEELKLYRKKIRPSAPDPKIA